MKFHQIYRLVLSGLTILSISPAAVQADDTEIFFNIEGDVVQPNILFILDNSGSMDADVEVQSSDYDSSENYSGQRSDDYIFYQDGYYNNMYSVKKSVIKCQDIFKKLNTVGKTAPYKMSYYYGSRWNSFDSDSVANLETVCEADGGNGSVGWYSKEPHVFYSANYLNWYFNHRESTTMTRMEIVQKVTNDLVEGLEGVNVGLMAFNENNYNEGGKILVPVEDVAQNRSMFKQAVDNLSPKTNTPLSETLFGARRYFQGERPFLSYPSEQANGSMQGDKYKSPISMECQANYVVFLTDGEPTKDKNHNTYMKDELGIGPCPKIVTEVEGVVENCLAEVAGDMNQSDLRDDLEGDQTAIIHTIGFLTDQTLLADTAAAGGGDYYLADNVDNLGDIFNKIVKQALSANTTFSSPGVSVNNFNQLNHLDALYFSVFEPVVNPLWPGNLKRYRLRSDGTIVDQNDNNAISDETGYFKDSAQSYWSTNADGATASAGGVASRVPLNNSLRNVYTYYEGSASLDLTASANAMSVSNSDNITKAMFGDADMSDAEHKKLINWTRGQDVKDEDDDGNVSEGRKFVADPLHSQPNLLVYGGSEESPDTTVFFGDNQGFIHAIDGETGALDFSFIPAELLANQKELMVNQVAEGQRPYGMDGSVVTWFNDADNNRKVNSGDHVYIYSGMRRGGRSYYALDATDRDAPKILWTIHGGSGDFSELGQSWANPVKKQVRIGGDVKDVLFIAGGYDPQQDNVSVKTEDGVGRALFMVEATTGSLLWWAGPSDSGANLELDDLDYSIPATPAVIDMNGDGLSDQLYVGDMGGQLLRFDFNNGNSADDFATGGVIASLAGDAPASNRRFYHTPDISGTLSDGARHLNVVVGSGYQASPLSKAINDRIYKVTVSDISAPTNDNGDIDYTKLTESDLFDTTDNLIQQGTDNQRETAQANLDDTQGWFIRLTRNGEKVLASSTTLRGDIFITSFEPSGSVSACVPAAGQSRLYHVKLADGRAVVNYNGLGKDDALTVPDREKILSTLGLPPSPTPVTIEGEVIILTGTETTKPPKPKGLVRKIYWYEE